MALFGESNGQNHAERAIHAALAILSDLEPLRAEVRKAHGVEFRLRSTINSGAVTLGTIGDSLRSDYAAAGETANTAAQLLQVAQPGQILITEETQRLAGGGFLTENLGKVGRVGVSTQTRAFAVQGWRPTSLVALLCA
jgi:class 3 adenylate cyclase